MKSDDLQKKDSEVSSDDVVFEEENNESADVDLRGKTKDLRLKLKEAETKVAEYLAGWQRAKADLINARRQDEESKREIFKFANERLIDGLVPVLESFDMAMGNKEMWEKVDKNWRTGVEYIAGQFKKVLEESGLTEVNPLGEKFDPMRDEAAGYEPVTDEKQNHLILKVIQKGYKLNDRIIRAPKVVVGEFKK